MAALRAALGRLWWFWALCDLWPKLPERGAIFAQVLRTCPIFIIYMKNIEQYIDGAQDARGPLGGSLSRPLLWQVVLGWFLVHIFGVGLPFVLGFWINLRPKNHQKPHQNHPKTHAVDDLRRTTMDLKSCCQQLQARRRTT